MHKEENVSTDDVEAMRFQDILCESTACLLFLCIQQGIAFPECETDCRSWAEIEWWDIARPSPYLTL